MPDSCRRGQSTRSRQREQEPRYLGKDYEEKRREGQAVGGIAQGLGQVARVLPRAANQPAQRPEDAVDEVRARAAREAHDRGAVADDKGHEDLAPHDEQGGDGHGPPGSRPGPRVLDAGIGVRGNIIERSDETVNVVDGIQEVVDKAKVAELSALADELAEEEEIWRWDLRGQLLLLGRPPVHLGAGGVLFPRRNGRGVPQPSLNQDAV